MTPTIKKKKSPAVSSKKNTAPRLIKPVEIKPTKILPPPNPSLRLYRRIAGIFVGFVGFVLLAVVFLSTTKAIIKVTPLEQLVETSFLLRVVAEAPDEGEIIGKVVEQTFEQAKSFPVNGAEQKEVLDKSGGEVKIINTSSKNQPLVATTRLLSSGGVLFRLDEGVTVPAGGEVMAMVHADQIGPTGDIGSDKFTIPGLSTSLQALIYAESSSAMTGGRKMVSVVTQEELDFDAEQLTGEITAFGQEQLRVVEKENLTGEAFSFQVISKESDTEPGEEKDLVTISMKIKVSAVFFDGAPLEKITKTKLYENLSDGFIFIKEGGDNVGLVVKVTEANAETGQANLKISADKASIVSNTSPFLQPEIFAGKTVTEARDYLISSGVAKEVSVSLFPPWFKTITKMKDHILVEVED